MPVYTIYNIKTKEIFSNLNFVNQEEANQYLQENYNLEDGYKISENPFIQLRIFLGMFLPGENPRFVYYEDAFKKVAGIFSEDGKSIFHCGDLLISDRIHFQDTGIKLEKIKREDFIKLHNYIISSQNAEL
jgi:hypothetical protein